MLELYPNCICCSLLNPPAVLLLSTRYVSYVGGLMDLLALDLSWIQARGRTGRLGRTADDSSTCLAFDKLTFWNVLPLSLFAMPEFYLFPFL
jgi:hypothetical protein